MVYVVDETANFFRCSMNTCNETSSVRTGAPPSCKIETNNLVDAMENFVSHKWNAVKQPQLTQHFTGGNSGSLQNLQSIQVCQIVRIKRCVR